MPAIKSSSKTGTSLVLFATERRGLTNAMKTLTWICQHSGDAELSDLCGEARDKIGAALLRVPSPETNGTPATGKK